MPARRHAPKEAVAVASRPPAGGRLSAPFPAPLMGGRLPQDGPHPGEGQPTSVRAGARPRRGDCCRLATTGEWWAERAVPRAPMGCRTPPREPPPLARGTALRTRAAGTPPRRGDCGRLATTSRWTAERAVPRAPEGERLPQGGPHPEEGQPTSHARRGLPPRRGDCGPRRTTGRWWVARAVPRAPEGVPPSAEETAHWGVAAFRGGNRALGGERLARRSTPLRAGSLPRGNPAAGEGAGLPEGGG